MSKRRPRAVTIKGEGARVHLLVVPYPEDIQRPRTRGECVAGPRPCPWVSCRHHLYIDVNRRGRLRLNFKGVDVDELEDSCALDVADRGGATLDEIATVYNIARSRAGQLIGVASLNFLRRARRTLEVFRGTA